MRAVAKVINRSRFLSTLSLCLVCMLIAAPAAADGERPGKRVLLVFDEDKGLPGLAVLDRWT